MHKLNRIGLILLPPTFTFLVLLALINTKRVHAHLHKESDRLVSDLSFIENKRQWNEEARFKAEIPGGAVFITDKGFVYNFRSSEDMEHMHGRTCSSIPIGLPASDIRNEYVRYHSYRVNFVGSNLSGQYFTEGERNYYHNYFLGNDRNKWAGGVRLYEKVVQKNVYDGIDVAIYSVGSSLKYDFIVSAGADPSQIVLAFEGVVPELMDDGQLKISTSVNEVIESPPYVYQVIGGQAKVVHSKYKLSQDQLTFEFPNGYNADYELIIDPVLVFATHSGTAGGEALANATTHDKSGNLYAGAFLIDISSRWPTTIGAYQEKSGGNAEVGINKYNTTGTVLLYSTYYGGRGNDIVHAMIVNDKEELIIIGHTTSANLPTTTGCYDSTFNGGSDIFVARFSPGGDQLLAATYIGGLNNEGNNINFSGLSSEVVSPMEVALNGDGDIWVVTHSNSNDFPVTANAFQSVNGGDHDAVVVGLDAGCSRLLYGSYMGGSGKDGAFNAVFNSAGNIVVCGNTQSDDFPTTAGVLHSLAPGGSCDGFVLIVNTQTGSLMHSTYLGTPEMDMAYRLQVDEEDNIFVLGTTQGDYPISANVYHIPSASTFIDKLSYNLDRSLLSTRLGNPVRSRPITPSAFLYDVCGNIYVTGFDAHNSMPVTEDAYDKIHKSFWFCVFKPRFTDLHYATYFGSGQGDHAEYGIHRFDKGGIVYQAICTQSDSFPTTPDAVFPKKRNRGVDNLSFKFDFQIPIVESRFELLSDLRDSGCAPYTVQFVNTSRFGDKFIWDFGDGSPLSHSGSAAHTFIRPGVYEVALYAQNDTTCNKYDTFYKTITVLAPPDLAISVEDTAICNFDQQINISVQIESSNLPASIQWGPLDGIIGSSNTSSITVNPFINSEYYVTVTIKDTLGICTVSVTDTFHINNGLVDLLHSATLRLQAACKDDTNGFAWLSIDPGDNSIPYSLLWRSTFDTTVLSDTDTLKNVGSGKYTLQITTPECDTTLHFMIPEEDFQVSFSVDSIVCINEMITFENTSDKHFTIFHWDFDDGHQSDIPSPQHNYSQEGSYRIQLRGEGVICKDTSYQTIVVDPVVYADFTTDKDSICTGESISFSHLMELETISDLHWQMGTYTDFSSLDKTIYYAYDHSGTMYVTLTGKYRACPENSFLDSVYVFDLPKVDLGSDDVLCLNGTPLLLRNLNSSMSPQRYLWSTGDTTETLRVIHPGIYSLTVSEEPMGCNTTESIEVRKDCYIDIPNAFTPNGDGFNDYFFPRQYLTSGIISFRFRVFNRWGQIVFETTSIEGRGWDGRFNSKDQPQGVYVYRMDVVFKENQTEHYQGNVTLLR